MHYDSVILLLLYSRSHPFRLQFQALAVISQHKLGTPDCGKWFLYFSCVFKVIIRVSAYHPLFLDLHLAPFACRSILDFKIAPFAVDAVWFECVCAWFVSTA